MGNPEKNQEVVLNEKVEKIAAVLLTAVMAFAVLTACGGADTGAGVALTKRTNELLAEDGISVEYSAALQSKAQIVANEVNNIPADKVNNANDQTKMLLLLQAVTDGVKKAGLVQGEDWNLLSKTTSEEQAKQLAEEIRQLKESGKTVTAIGMAKMTFDGDPAMSVVFQYTTDTNN